MKKLLHNIAWTLLSLTMLTGVTGYASAGIIKTGNEGTGIMIPKDRQWKSAPKFKKPARPSITPLSLTLGPTGGYNLHKGPDGSQWYSTQTYTVDSYYYTSSEITVYNSTGEVQGTISVTIPEGTQVNQIMPGDVISSNLFDKDKNTYELPVMVHIIHSPGVASYITYVYDIASGELKNTYEGFVSVVPVYTGYSYEWTAVVSYNATEDEVSVAKYDIYNKPGWSDTSAVLKHTFSVPASLAEYQVGGVLNAFEVDNSLYFVVSQYEKEYLDPASYQEPWDMIPTADNNFIATIYNKNFVEVGKITIPVASTDDYLVQYGVGLYGYDDLSKNFWDESGNMHLVITTTGFQITSESEDIAHDVYDMSGNKVKNIVANVSDWMKMYDIDGQSQQMAFLAKDEQSLSMVDVPACDTIVTFETTIEGYPISTNIDRYPVKDSYQYILGLPSAEYDANNSVHYNFAWVNKNATIDRIINFDLGTNNASWVPLVIGEVFNPYLFDTDSDREYVFIANQYAEGATSGSITDEIRIVNEDGTILRRYVEDSTGKGELGGASVLGLGTSTPTLFIPFMNFTDDTYTVELEFLPIEMFTAGGDGTAENPYLISSAGDLAMIARDTDAHYKVVKDFSMDDYGTWTPIEEFSGTLDGDNHVISGLVLDGNASYSALFATSENATIKNIILNAPSIEIENTGTAAFIVAQAITTTFSNIHIYDAVVTGSENAWSTFGSIVSMGALNSAISECSTNNLQFNGPACSTVGGIAADLRTGTTINACAASGTITAESTIGGIAGTTGTDCSIINCHVNANLTGNNSIGGIVGTADRGGIHLCHVEGSITANEGNWSGNCIAGGIAGKLAGDYSGTLADDIWNGMVISNNVVALSSMTLAATKGCHRVVGYTRYEEDVDYMQWDPTIVPTAEHALDKNYVLSTLAVIDSETEAGLTTTEGADVTAEELNKDFFSNLSFLFGTDAENPWNEESSSAPYLYFEQSAVSISMNPAELSLVEDETAEITVTIVGGNIENVTIESSDENVIAVTAKETEGNTILVTVKCTGVGNAEIKAEIDGLTAVCKVTTVSGIAEVTADSTLDINYDGTMITAAGAAGITVYNIAGINVASTTGASVSTSNLAAGVYVVVATDDHGSKSTAKLVIK